MSHSQPPQMCASCPALLAALIAVNSISLIFDYLNPPLPINPPLHAGTSVLQYLDALFAPQHPDGSPSARRMRSASLPVSLAPPAASSPTLGTLRKLLSWFS